MQEIPKYNLDEAYRPVHRESGDHGSFGYNSLDRALWVKGFELYSSQGLSGRIGPLRSAFYRIGVTIRGSCDVQLGLEHFVHQAGTVNCTFPNQIFSKWNISDDLFGYYLLFEAEFLGDLIPDSRIAEAFAFFGYAGIPFFQLSPEELERVTGLIMHINEEVQDDRQGRESAIQHYLYLVLLELKRSYTRQHEAEAVGVSEPAALTSRYRRLVSQHYLEKRQVSEYAGMLYVTPNHLNRCVKEVSGRTASSLIDEMILQEAKVLLQYTDLSVSEISWRLRFSESSAFNRFFKKGQGITPLAFRANA